MSKATLLAAVGKQLRRYEIDLVTGAGTVIHREDTLEKIDYACADPQRGLVYVACSDGRPGVPGTRHYLQVLTLSGRDRDRDRVLADGGSDGSSHSGDSADGGRWPAVPLRSRALHVCLDRERTHLLVTFNDPSGLQVYKLGPQGEIEDVMERYGAEHSGIFAHQTALNDDNSVAVIVSRGNDAKPGRAEDPGSLNLFDYGHGRLTAWRKIAPRDGYGFGPRNVAFHPSRPWIYVSLERQNKVCMFRLDQAAPDDAPVFEKDLLADPASVFPRQLAGSIEIHPNGRFLYVANRADHQVAMEDRQGRETSVFGGGENNIAVFALDPHTGEPRLLEHVDTGGCYPRTFSIDADAACLMVANGKRMPVLRAGDVHEMAAGFTLFGIAADGRLSFSGRKDIPLEGEDTLFWAALVPGADCV